MILACLILLVALCHGHEETRRRMGDTLSRLAARLPKTAGGRLMLLIALTAMAAGLIVLARTELVGFAAPAVPDALAWFTLFDMGTVIDFAAVLMVAAMTTRLRSLLRAARRLTDRAVRLVGAMIRRRRAVRVRRLTGSKARNSDDEPGFADGWAFAA